MSRLQLCADSPFGQYLGIPLAAGILTRFTMLRLTSRRFLETTFLPYFGPLALLGLLYTIVVMFAYQGHHIVHNLGPVFRVLVPLILYFVSMWSAAFALVWWCGARQLRPSRTVCGSEHGGDREEKSETEWSYEMAVVQSFTAASNNFVSLSLGALPPGCRGTGGPGTARPGSRQLSL